MQSQADLLEVVGALSPPGRLTGRLHGGQQQGDQNRDDRDHHQQFDQGESASIGGLFRVHVEAPLEEQSTTKMN